MFEVFRHCNLFSLHARQDGSGSIRKVPAKEVLAHMGGPNNCCFINSLVGRRTPKSSGFF
jgi:hypothetical protein